jgi:hypothetical protein
MTMKTAPVRRARTRLVRALDDLIRHERDTYAYREAIYKHVPNAIENLVEIKVAALFDAAKMLVEEEYRR